MSLYTPITYTNADVPKVTIYMGRTSAETRDYINRNVYEDGTPCANYLSVKQARGRISPLPEKGYNAAPVLYNRITAGAGIGGVDFFRGPSTPGLGTARCARSSRKA